MDAVARAQSPHGTFRSLVFPLRVAMVVIDQSVLPWSGTMRAPLSAMCMHARAPIRVGSSPPSWHAQPSRLPLSFSLRYSGAPMRFLPGSNPPRHGGMLDRRLRLWHSRPSSHSRPTLPPSVQANTYREV